MRSRFIDCDRDTLYLLPPSIQDWLPEHHLARFVVEIVAQLDLTPLQNAYAGRGSAPYSPSMLLALLFYGYATGVFSSRKLEAATYDSVAFRYITANKHPDHDTIATFRKRFLGQLKSYFKDILMIAHTMGLLKLGKVSLDGTKVKANASKHHALSWKHACKLEKQLQDEVERLLHQAEKADKDVLPDAMSIPEELSRRKERLEAISKAKAEIKKRAAQRYAKEKELYDKKVAQRQAKEKASGKKPRGRKPKPPEPGPKKDDQVNLTDKESRIMPSSDGGFEQAYNAQAGVDMDAMFIVENHTTQQPNEKQQMRPAVRNLSSLPSQLGKVEAAVTDAGYFSEDNVKACEEYQIVPYIATKRDKHNVPLEERFFDPGPLPKDADSVAKLKHRLQTPESRELYAKRKSTIETVFGIIKSVIGFRQFLLRGLESVSGEWNLVCIGYNLKRMHALSTPK